MSKLQWESLHLRYGKHLRLQVETHDGQLLPLLSYIVVGSEYSYQAVAGGKSRMFQDLDKAKAWVEALYAVHKMD